MREGKLPSNNASPSGEVFASFPDKGKPFFYNNREAPHLLPEGSNRSKGSVCLRAHTQLSQPQI